MATRHKGPYTIALQGEGHSSRGSSILSSALACDMRFLGLSLSLLLLFAGFSLRALAQVQNLTDAQRVDLAGPVKSVSVETTTATGVVWSQPGGPSMVLPIWCHECEFDPNGNRTKFGRFQGETVHLFFDGQGNVTERVAADAETGETVRHEIAGPFGNTEETSYRGGALPSRVLFTYDQFRHRIDWLTLDAGGNQQGRTVVHTDKDGNDTEQWDYGKEEELLLHVRQTLDPKTKIEHFTSFDQSGGVKLTWTVTGGMLSAFRELPDSQSEYRDGFSEDIGNDTFATYQCRSDGTCDRSRVYYVYLDAKRRNPQSVEWRDASGDLIYAAYYDYEMDACRNWAHRTIWVWSKSLGERKLYETDFRVISYWPR
jgi:hypothetical protein